MQPEGSAGTVSFERTDGGQGRPVAGDGTDWQRELKAFRRERRRLFYPKTDQPWSAAPPLPSGNQDAELRRQLAEICQDRLGERVTRLAPLGEAGTFHWLYRAQFERREPVVLRVSALPEQCDLPLLLDRWAMERLDAVGLPALRVWDVDLSRRRCPFDYAILDEAAGTPLSALDDDEARTQALLCELGRVVAVLHRVPTVNYGLLDIRLAHGEGGLEHPAPGLCETWREYLLRNLAEHVGVCRQIGAVNRDEARTIAALFESLGDLPLEGGPALLHGDLGSHNVFTDGTAITALLDWEDCLSGDPVFDVAFWATFHPERRHRAFLNGYASEQTLAPDFEWRFWRYFLRIALAKTVLRHRFGLTDRPGRTPAARRIQLGLERVEAIRNAA